ncbi:hypothetical protein [Tenacibaculum finnmarkense]|uniref:hypothetical protein n=1 Tax=Tenacibaculum finnmarkense TaxID=2781243 RepID=UPI001EFB12ED|nr:hypothetical protein [Tenacibaculum finnmarkense]MCG8750543.1 hypothetical protein [Tenacibaculum finnmarkense]MCG8755540.1 hypothetical protein [Tenacibaculum finnmarkense]MCG8784124.1 hypothetical protein [Tenacibaculum finnmarkense]
MENIKALIVKTKLKISEEGEIIRGEIILPEIHNYDFSYSKTGSVKFTGKYKPKYFKKEVLNSYESIRIGTQMFLLFTDDFAIDEDKCKRNLLNLFISNTESEIKSKKEYLTSLKYELSKYN